MELLVLRAQSFISIALSFFYKLDQICQKPQIPLSTKKYEHLLVSLDT